MPPEQNPVNNPGQPQVSGPAPGPALDPAAQPVAGAPVPPPAGQASVAPQAGPAPLPQPQVLSNQGAAPDPMAPAAFAQPVQQGQVNTTDPTQPGYIPPAVPVQPAGAYGANNAPSPRGFNKKILIPAAVTLVVVVGIILFGAIGILSSGSIKASDLAEETAEGMTFKRPKQWSRPGDAPSQVKVFYSNRDKLDDSNMLLFAAAQPVGISYELLTQAEKDEVKDVVKTNLSAGGGGVCAEGMESTLNDSSQTGYDAAYEANMTCDRVIDGKKDRVVMRAIIGFYKQEMHILSVGMNERHWGKSTDAIDEITASFRPASL